MRGSQQVDYSLGAAWDAWLGQGCPELKKYCLMCVQANWCAELDVRRPRMELWLCAYEFCNKGCCCRKFNDAKQGCTACSCCEYRHVCLACGSGEHGVFACPTVSAIYSECAHLNEVAVASLRPCWSWSPLKALDAFRTMLRGFLEASPSCLVDADSFAPMEQLRRVKDCSVQLLRLIGRGPHVGKGESYDYKELLKCVRGIRDERLWSLSFLRDHDDVACLTRRRFVSVKDVCDWLLTSVRESVAHDHDIVSAKDVHLATLVSTCFFQGVRRRLLDKSDVWEYDRAFSSLAALLCKGSPQSLDHIDWLGRLSVLVTRAFREFFDGDGAWDLCKAKSIVHGSVLRNALVRFSLSTENAYRYVESLLWKETKQSFANLFEFPAFERRTGGFGKVVCLVDQVVREVIVHEKYLQYGRVFNTRCYVDFCFELCADVFSAMLLMRRNVKFGFVEQVRQVHQTRRNYRGFCSTEAAAAVAVVVGSSAAKA